jgi:hypothetical protein
MERKIPGPGPLLLGAWNDFAILDDGSRVEVRDLRGHREKVINRW